MILPSALTLIVSIAFVFQVKSDSIEVNFSTPFVMTCHHNELGDVIKWSYDDEDVFDCIAPYSAGECNVTFFTKKNLERVFIFNVDSSKNTSFLTITDRKEVLRMKENSSIWRCFHGDSMLEYKFKNTKSAEITQLLHLSNDIPEENQKMTLSCLVNTTSPFTATWSSSRRGVLEMKKNQTGENNTVDIVTQCTDNIDTFTCSIDNGESYPVVESINIIVKCKTKFLEEDMNKIISVYKGQNATLSATYIGNRVMPRKKIWRRKYDNEEVELSNYRTRKIDDDPYGSNRLIIYSVQPQDEGDYKLELVDGTTTIHTMFTVKIISRPDMISSPFPWYIGIAIGAGTMLLFFITYHIILCVYRKKRNKTENDNYLTQNISARRPGKTDTNIVRDSESYDNPEMFRSRDTESTTYENFIEKHDENDF